ncbi:PREDICTED: heat stress transcription factor A-8-like isoform X2 [Camelina sativa]|uniref:Heat stress transcription factor A-8-like isoform X1 n=1 Tax=Camelina sativa TaxID=90675 RepID=A0ABM1Q901_CAMSA|nr:PREDICTED: heat stress transcription factor A-8-like isoform X1 [Camelina sativa]XP_019083239.1 PREDICTED: heat stress transcription factor A-8-like isoform X2 [Camelina sativa]
MVKSAAADDGGGGGSSSVAPFLRKCYEMVDDSSTDSIISWSTSADNSFVILDTTVFSVQLLPKYFKHSNFSSFIRQLNIYGFKKVDADRWEFANDGFVKGQKDLLKNVIRRKNVQSNEQSKQESKSTTNDGQGKLEKSGLWKEVDILKGDKQVLAQELIKVRQYQEITDTKMLNLKDRVQGMEESQQEMLSFLVMVMKNPSLLVQLLQPKEKNSWRKAGEGATIVEEVTDEGDSNSYGLPLVAYQPPSDNGTSKSSSNDLNDFLRNADMMKFCLDENHVPLIIPDLYDDGAWEKLLLLSPSKKKTKKQQENSLKKGKDDDTLEEMESDKSRLLELISEEMEKSDDFEYGQLTPERSRNLDIMTEQMSLLASNE